ncbi:UNVERIFIED_CONTAM: hypothetical protein H355_006134, partial [Colinus virginianus]
KAFQLQVDGTDLRDASYEQAVEAIQNADNPVVFVVQSIISRSRPLPFSYSPQAYGQSDSEPERTLFCNFPLPPSSVFSGMRGDVSWSSSSENEFGYSWSKPILCGKITQYYEKLPGELHMAELEKGKTGLGLSLAGNKDQSRMNVFIEGIDPNGAAGKGGQLQTADELLEIDTAADSVVSSDFSSYENIQYVELPKDEEGLGIVISEEDTVTGVVIKSLTDNGAAAKDGRIKVGNRILAVDDEIVVGYPVEKAPGDSLGLSIAGGVGSLLGDIPIFIAVMHPNGVAAQTQKLRVGDRIVSICGISTEGMTHSQAVSILKNASGTIELQVVAGGDVTVITGQQQGPPVSSLSLAGLTSTSIFQDDLGSVTI